MSEKRFIDTNEGIYDNQEKRLYKINAYEFYDCETDEVVDLLNELYDENEKLQKDMENLQEVVAEFGATLLMNGFEIEINNENLSEVIDDD